MQGRHHILLLLLLPLLCAGCALSDTVRRLNTRYGLTQSVGALQAQALEEYTCPDSIRTLYPLTRAHQDEAERYLATALEIGDTTLILQLGRLLGRGDLVLHFAPAADRPARAEGALLIGNYGEALRLSLGDKALTATQAMAHLMLGDTAKAVLLLEKSLDTVAKETGLTALRLLQHLKPSDPTIRERLYRATPLDAEKVYLEILSMAKRPTDKQIIRNYAQRLLDTRNRTTLWEYSTEALSPYLVQHGLFVALYDLQGLLDKQTDTPYRLILQHTEEINLLRSYEAGEVPDPIPHDKPRSFRQRYGSVERVPNWAMTYHRGQSATLPIPLSPKEYQLIRSKISKFFSDRP